MKLTSQMPSSTSLIPRRWPAGIPEEMRAYRVRRVIPLDDAVSNIRVAVDARPDRDFLIVARTDSRYSEGMDAALKRGERFLEARADVLFVETPESLER